MAKKATASKKKAVKKKATRKTRADSLTPLRRVEIFCQEIMKGATQSDAYRKSHPGATGSTDETIHCNASQYAASTKVQQRLFELRREYRIQNAGEVAEIIKGIARVSNFDPRQLYDEDGQLLPINQLSDEVALAIEEINFETKDGVQVVKRVKSGSRLGANKLLGDRHGLFKGGDVLYPAGMTLEDKPKIEMQMDVTNMEAKEAGRKYMEILESIDVGSTKD